MEIVNKRIQEYAEAFTSAEPSLLTELNRETYMNHLFPRMLSGHHQGRFLSMISHMLKPRRILEIGTYTGYSAICLAEGLSEDGELHSIEINNENEDIIKKYVKMTPNGNRIIIHFGDALEVLQQLDGPFDLVFLDADKESYVDYFNIIIGNVRSGGMILADNVLWDGKVLDQGATDKESVGIRKFNEFIRNHDDVEHVLLTIRDGIMLIRKK